jgi:hypothetical protein
MPGAPDFFNRPILPTKLAPSIGTHSTNLAQPLAFIVQSDALTKKAVERYVDL